MTYRRTRPPMRFPYNRRSRWFSDAQSTPTNQLFSSFMRWSPRSSSSRRDLSRSLYWRSWRGLPTGPQLAATRRGTGSPRCYQNDRGTGGDRLLPASRLGPSGLPMPGSGRMKKGTGGSQGEPRTSAAIRIQIPNPDSRPSLGSLPKQHQRVLPHTRQLCGSFAVVGRFCIIGVSPGSHRGQKFASSPVLGDSALSRSVT